MFNHHYPLTPTTSYTSIYAYHYSTVSLFNSWTWFWDWLHSSDNESIIEPGVNDMHNENDMHGEIIVQDENVIEVQVDPAEAWMSNLVSHFTAFSLSSQFSMFLKQIYIAYHMDKFDELSDEDEGEDESEEESEDQEDAEDKEMIEVELDLEGNNN